MLRVIRARSSNSSKYANRLGKNHSSNESFPHFIILFIDRLFENFYRIDRVLQRFKILLHVDVELRSFFVNTCNFRVYE